MVRKASFCCESITFSFLSQTILFVLEEKVNNCFLLIFSVLLISCRSYFILPVTYFLSWGVSLIIPHREDVPNPPSLLSHSELIHIFRMSCQNTWYLRCQCMRGLYAAWGIILIYCISMQWCAFSHTQSSLCYQW